jgi:hypothetical protein
MALHLRLMKMYSSCMIAKLIPQKNGWMVKISRFVLCN